VARRHGKWGNGKGVRIFIFTRRKMRDFSHFRRKMCDSKSPLNIFAGWALTMIRREAS
jgi:hypothetical protein